VSRDFPGEQHIFHLVSLSNVVHDHVTASRALAIDNDPNVRHVAAKIVRNQIAGIVVSWMHSDRQRFPFALEKDHQIRHPPMIDVAIGFPGKPPPLPWIGREILLHILVDLLLKVHAHGAVGANDFIGADSGIARNITTRIGDAYIGRIVANGLVGSFNSSTDETSRKVLRPVRMYRGKLRWRTGANEHEDRENLFRHRKLQE